MSDKKPMGVDAILLSVEFLLKPDDAHLAEDLIAATRHSERTAILAEFKALVSTWRPESHPQLLREITALITTIESRKP